MVKAIRVAALVAGLGLVLFTACDKSTDNDEPGVVSEWSAAFIGGALDPLGNLHDQPDQVDEQAQTSVEAARDVRELVVPVFRVGRPGEPHADSDHQGRQSDARLLGKVPQLVREDACDGGT